MNTITVIALARRFKRLEKPLRRSAEAIFKALKKNGVELDIFLVSDSRMRALNKRWRGMGKATNVLSFTEPKSFPHPELRSIRYKVLRIKHMKRMKYLGELYLAPDYIRAHHEDIRFLLIHGILHLLGYTHDGKRDTMKMERMEKKLLRLDL